MARITDVNPHILPTEGGTTITITGSGFKQATGVITSDVNSRKIAMKSYKIESDTKITAVSPKLDRGSFYVYVMDKGGESDTPLVRGNVSDGDTMKGATGVTLTDVYSKVNRIVVFPPMPIYEYPTNILNAKPTIPEGLFGGDRKPRL